jgi:hypothetical protein
MNVTASLPYQTISISCYLSFALFIFPQGGREVPLHLLSSLLLLFNFWLGDLYLIVWRQFFYQKLMKLICIFYSSLLLGFSQWGEREKELKSWSHLNHFEGCRSLHVSYYQSQNTGFKKANLPNQKQHFHVSNLQFWEISTTLKWKIKNTRN